ncbi:MAG: VanW family protein [Sulfobacillus sp.]|nr:VanW family protein [Sulfobacillus sp.]
MRYWIMVVWLLLWPNVPLPTFLAPHGGRQWAQLEYVPSAPVVVVPGESAARAMKLPYLLARQTTNYNHASPSQAKNIELVAQRLNGTVVKPGQIFSYYARVGPYTAENGFGWGRMFVGDRIVPSIGGGVCQGSSTLYAALLRTGLPIIERHHHGLTVPYLPPGEDATVASDYLDFRFKNNRTTPILITAQAGQRHLTVAIWGATPGPEIVVKHQILAEYPFKIVKRVDPKLKPGQEQVLAPGQKGVSVKTWLEIKTPHGTETRDLGIDRYRPSPRIIAVGPKTPSADSTGP